MDALNCIKKFPRAYNLECGRIAILHLQLLCKIGEFKKYNFFPGTLAKTIKSLALDDYPSTHLRRQRTFPLKGHVAPS